MWDDVLMEPDDSEKQVADLHSYRCRPILRGNRKW
jgi:hypothetical protein